MLKVHPQPRRPELSIGTSLLIHSPHIRSMMKAHYQANAGCTGKGQLEFRRKEVGNGDATGCPDAVWTDADVAGNAGADTHADAGSHVVVPREIPPSEVERQPDLSTIGVAVISAHADLRVD